MVVPQLQGTASSGTQLATKISLRESFVSSNEVVESLLEVVLLLAGLDPSSSNCVSQKIPFEVVFYVRSSLKVDSEEGGGRRE